MQLCNVKYFRSFAGAAITLHVTRRPPLRRVDGALVDRDEWRRAAVIVWVHERREHETEAQQQFNSIALEHQADLSVGLL